jgi:hypothetical protein
MAQKLALPGDETCTWASRPEADETEGGTARAEKESG